MMSGVPVTSGGATTRLLVIGTPIIIHVAQRDATTLLRFSPILRSSVLIPFSP